jgi:hypothetical protein
LLPDREWAPKGANRKQSDLAFICVHAGEFHRADSRAIAPLMIRKLRDEAKTQLGPKFDIKAFHDQILNGGAMPLDLLQERVERWIKEQGPKTAAAK